MLTHRGRESLCSNGCHVSTVRCSYFRAQDIMWAKQLSRVTLPVPVSASNYHMSSGAPEKKHAKATSTVYMTKVAHCAHMKQHRMQSLRTLAKTPKHVLDERTPFKEALVKNGQHAFGKPLLNPNQPAPKLASRGVHTADPLHEFISKPQHQVAYFRTTGRSLPTTTQKTPKALASIQVQGEQAF